MRFKFALLLGALGVVAMAGCATPQASTPSTSSESSSVAASSSPEAMAASSPSSSAMASTAASPDAMAQPKYAPLLSVVSNTKAAVDAKDFAKATQEFGKFEGVWHEVEDGVKAKSSSSYDGIEQDMDQINAALKGSDAAKSLAALQSLQSHIQGIPH